MTICGVTGITERGRKIIRDPVRGIFTEIVYEGTCEAIKAAYSTIPATMYVECDTLSGPVGRLTIRTPDYGDGADNGEIISTYDLPSNQSQKHIFEHPKAQALGTETLAEIWSAHDSDTTVSGLSVNGETILEMLRLKQDYFFASQPVFRHSRFVARGAAVTVAQGSVGRIYSSAQVIAETGAPAVWQLAINGAYAGMVGFYGSAPSGHTIGWLKAAPQFSGVAGNKTVVTVEYMLEAWRNFSYTP